jgi:glucosyl-3-phosphoglycerate synthase
MIEREAESDPGASGGGAIASFHHRDFPLGLLLSFKAGTTVSVCIPARNEASTIGPIVASIERSLGAAGSGLVDEVVVVDDHSADATADVAASSGARVVRPSHLDSGPGKGEAMARGVAACQGELVVFLDGDVEDFGPHFVTGLLGPLLVDPSLVLVKGRYRRPIDGRPTGGGRVTELVARPVISLCFPDLGGVEQPLAGETAIRRGVLEQVTLAGGYAVELALLIDVAERFGCGAIAQVDLGVRTHRNRSLNELVPQARDVLRAALDRVGAPSP